jgi:hypothetical protein
MDEAWPLMLEFNARCTPPWTEAELIHKLACADDWDGIRGSRLRATARRIEVHVRPDDPVVFIGLDCARPGHSFVKLEPGLWAGFVRLGRKRELAVELAALDWEGKEVVLTPASTINTNKKEVWEHYWLGELLRREGARVTSLRLPPLEGRRRTLSQVGDVDWEVVDPPRSAREAGKAALEASKRAKALDAERKSLPRKKASPALDRAMSWLTKKGVTRLTKDVLRDAKRKGLTRGTLKRALGLLPKKNGMDIGPLNTSLSPSLMS